MPEKTIKRRLQDCDAALASDEGENCRWFFIQSDADGRSLSAQWTAGVYARRKRRPAGRRSAGLWWRVASTQTLSIRRCMR
jgi:hypothetical protein